MSKRPYGMGDSGAGARCTNSNFGTFNHECGKPATWIGTARSGFEACYCADCKERGDEGRTCVSWRAL